MENILKHIQELFLSKASHFNTFAHSDSRLEDWFKAEIIVLLDTLKQKGFLDDFRCEFTIPIRPKKKRVDFGIIVHERVHLVELKALCISKTSTRRDLKFYFREDKVGIIKDFRKLDTIHTVPAGQKHIIGFIYPNPGDDKWIAMVESLPENLKHWQCKTRPSDFPDFLFVSVWEINKIIQD